MKKTFFALLIFSSFATCKNDGDKINYDQMAKDLCACMRPLSDVNIKIKELVREGNTDEVASLFTEVEKIAADGELCAKSLEEKYGLVNETNETKATAALKKNCPDIAKMLEQSDASE